MTITSITAGEGDAEAIRSMNEWDRSVDPQLPERDFAAGDRLLAATSDGAIRALGLSRVARLAEQDPEALWGAARRASIELRWDGDAVAVGELLDRWIADVRPELRPAGGDESAAGSSESDWESAFTAVVPSRDSGLVRPLLSRGFALVGAEAIRVGRRASDADAALARLAATGVSLRPASLADLELIATMDSELFAHETQHGGATARPNPAAILRQYIEERLRADPDWTWIVEQGGDAVGYFSLEIDRPRHRAQVAAGGPVAHIQALYLRPTVRGGGVGEAIAEFGHGRLEQAGFDRILLNYSALNPRSGPFWCRMGYRPIWSSWQRRPAR